MKTLNRNSFLSAIFCLILILGFIPVLKSQEKKFPEMVLPEKVLATLKTEHPRIHATAADFEALKARVASDPVLKKWFESLKSDGERIISEEPSIYSLPDGLRLFGSASRVLDRVSTLGLLTRSMAIKNMLKGHGKSSKLLRNFLTGTLSISLMSDI